MLTKATLCSGAIRRLRDCEMERRDVKPNRIPLCELILGAVRRRDYVPAPFCDQPRAVIRFSRQTHVALSRAIGCNNTLIATESMLAAHTCQQDGVGLETGTIQRWILKSITPARASGHERTS